MTNADAPLAAPVLACTLPPPELRRRRVEVLALASAVLVIAACGGGQEPVAPQPAPPEIASVPGAPAPAPAPAPISAPVAATPPAAASSVGAGHDMDAVTLLGAVYERSLNEGDGPTAEACSSKACWAKECGSLSAQAKKKFKVRVKGEPQVRGVHAVLTMDVLCEGKRPCDRVHLLIMKDCAPNAPQTWLVADVTEDEPKRSAWLDSAPAPCR